MSWPRRWRSYNGFSAPLVIRVAIGGYLTGGADFHSQCGESIFTHIPTARLIFFPSGRLADRLRRGRSGVLFLEHKQVDAKLQPLAPPRAQLHGPLAEGTVKCIVTYGAWCRNRARKTGIRRRPLRAIDPRTPTGRPLRLSVQKTNRVMIAHEDGPSFGFGAEIAARIAGELFTSLGRPRRPR